MPSWIDTLGRFSARIFERNDFCDFLLFSHQVPTEKGSTLKEKN